MTSFHIASTVRCQQLADGQKTDGHLISPTCLPVPDSHLPDLHHSIIGGSNPMIKDSPASLDSPLWHSKTPPGSMTTLSGLLVVATWQRGIPLGNLSPSSSHRFGGHPLNLCPLSDLAQGLIQWPLSPDAMFTILRRRRVAVVAFQSYATSSSDSQHQGEGGPPPILDIKVH